MRKKRRFIVLIVAVFCKPSVAQDLSDRLAHFELQKAEVSEGMSVLIEKVSLVEAAIPLSNSRSNSSPKFENKVSSTRTLQRIVFGSKGRRKRMDGISYSMLGAANILNADRETQLIHENVGWYLVQTKNPPKPGVVQFQVKAGVVPMTTDSKWKHPFDTSTSQGGGLHLDHRPILTQYAFKTIESETLKDGRERYSASIDSGGVCRITFDKEEGWCTEEIEFMKPIKGKSLEEERAEAKALAMGIPRKPITVTKEMLSGYRTSAITRTEWREVERNRWVPWKTRISTELRSENVEDEIRYRDWKFGGDVDELLLDESNFTPEKISASIDFKAIRDMFDRDK